jgi:hypothetical protein
MYLLKLNRKGNIYKDDDGVAGIPEFLRVLKTNGLGETAMKWVALVYDYESPYRHYNELERKKAVSHDLYNTYDWKSLNKLEIIEATKKYLKLQYDPLDEQLRAFNIKIDQFTDFMNDMEVNEESAESLQKIMIGIEKILKTRQSLLDAIERRGERQKIAGDKLLSFLEKRKENKEL